MEPVILDSFVQHAGLYSLWQLNTVSEAVVWVAWYICWCTNVTESYNHGFPFMPRTPIWYLYVLGVVFHYLILYPSNFAVHAEWMASESFLCRSSSYRNPFSYILFSSQFYAFFEKLHVSVLYSNKLMSSGACTVVPELSLLKSYVILWVHMWFLSWIIAWLACLWCLWAIVKFVVLKLFDTLFVSWSISLI